MAGAWTDERRLGARERALKSRLWEKSTGPRTNEGKAISARNSRKHGMRSREAIEIRRLMAEWDRGLEEVRF